MIVSAVWTVCVLSHRRRSVALVDMDSVSLCEVCSVWW